MIKYIKNELKHLPMMIIIAIIFCGIGTLATSYVTSKDVYYDNSVSNLNAGDMQDAIDEVFQHATDYNEIKTTIGDSSLTTTDKTLTGAVNEINSTIGSSTLNTTSQDLIGAVNEIKTKVTALEDYKNLIYPVGSIYISINNTNPGTLFGGTWVAFATGRTLVGMGSNGTNNYTTVGATGGSSTVNLAHSHTVNSHSHGLSSGYALITAEYSTVYFNVKSSSFSSNNYVIASSSSTISRSHSTAIGLGGNSGNSSPGTNSQLSNAQSIMNPYITVYMWKRTA